MAFTVKLGGREVTFKSEDDFARAMAAMDRVEQPPEKNGKSGKAPRASQAYDALSATLEFVEEIFEHPEGVMSSVIAQALKCDPRGIGRRLLEVDAVLKPLGFKREDVYDNSKRVAVGGRVYMPGPKIAGALEALNRKTGRG